MLWTCVSTFIKDEKSVKYKLACVLAGIGVFIVDMFIPYATLVNIIMTYCGYTGGIVFLVLTVRWLMVRKRWCQSKLPNATSFVSEKSSSFQMSSFFQLSFTVPSLPRVIGGLWRYPECLDE